MDGGIGPAGGSCGAAACAPTTGEDGVCAWEAHSEETSVKQDESRCWRLGVVDAVDAACTTALVSECRELFTDLISLCRELTSVATDLWTCRDLL
jgi:hypothetical protein